MGTHPIFESDFDCLTDWKKRDYKSLRTARKMRYLGLVVVICLIIPSESLRSNYQNVDKRSMHLVNISNNRRKSSWLESMITTVLNRIDQMNTRQKSVRSFTG